MKIQSKLVLAVLICVFSIFHNGQPETNDAEGTTDVETATYAETTTADAETEDGNSDRTTPVDHLDYSEMGEFNHTTYPTGGILVQFTKTGLAYIISMAERATVKVMRDFPIPDTEEGTYSVKNVRVVKFSDPILKAKFINQTGIEIQVIVPQVETSCDYSAGVGWFATKGTVKSNVEGLMISMLVRIVRGQNGYPSVNIPLCSGKVEQFRILFANAGFAGTLLNTMRGFMESIFVTSMGNIFCFAARNLTGLIDTVFLDFDKPMSEILAGALGPAAQQPAAGALDIKVICGEDNSAEKTEKPTKKRGAGGIASSVIAEMDELTLDLKMDEDGFFEPDEVVIGLNGDFYHGGKGSGLSPKPLQMVKTDRSMCFAVSQVVPNSFSIQGQNNGYFVLKKKIDISEFPIEVRAPLSLMCPRCSMQFYATTVEAPKVEFSSAGVRASAKTFVRIDGKGLFNLKVKVVEAVADVETLVNLNIDKNTVHGDVSLGSIIVKINKVGIGGIFDKPLNALLRKLIPKIVWPVVQKQINKHLKDKGFKLPAVCGLSFNNSQIVYTDGDVIVCTDVVYDLDGFLTRFTEWQKKQNELQQKEKNVSTTEQENQEEITAQPEEEETTAETSVASEVTNTARVLARQANDGLTK